MRLPLIPSSIPIRRDDSKHIIIMKKLYNALIEYREENTDRVLIRVFMCLPSRKDFPQYYSIIKRPISMNKIRENIEKQVYLDENQCFNDFRLMFTNCKFFNEDESQIFKDAVALERTLVKRRQQLLDEYNTHSSNTETSNLTCDNDFRSAINDGSNSLNSLGADSNSSTSASNSKHNDITSSSSTTTATTRVNDTRTNNNGHTMTNGLGQDNSLNNSIRNINSDTNDSMHFETNHDNHAEISMDSYSNMSADFPYSPSIDRGASNHKRMRTADGPKKQALTGYIIYASEVRKQVIEKNPNQNFGEISRLVGNEWKALPAEIKTKYDQKAASHNKKVRERELAASTGGDTSTPSNSFANGFSTTRKLSKRRLAKLTKEQMRRHHLSYDGPEDSLDQSSNMGHHISSPLVVSSHPSVSSQQARSNLGNALTNPRIHDHKRSSFYMYQRKKPTFTDAATQTTTLRFVEPPRKRTTHTETLKHYLSNMNIDISDDCDGVTDDTQATPKRADDIASLWLGAGLGRHESPHAALRALREFMLKDSATMRHNLRPYLDSHSRQ